MSRSYVILLVLFLVSIYSSSCKKIVTGNTETFIHTLPNPAGQSAYYIQETPDGGLLLIADGQKNPVSVFLEDFSIYKLDQYGNLQWKKTLPDTVDMPRITPLEDGGFLVGSSSFFGQLMRFDKHGEVIWKNQYYDGSGFLWAPPVMAPSGNIYISLSDGPTHYGPSNNVVQEFGPNGATGDYYFLDDIDFKGKIGDLVNYRVDENDYFWFYGRIYLNPFSWANNTRLFVSKWQLKSGQFNILGMNVLDSANDAYLSFINQTESEMNHILTSENDVVFTITQLSRNKIKRGYVSKVNEALQEVWSLPLNIGQFGTEIYSISENRDGSYLITGSSYVAESKYGQPMACRVSRDGKIIWSKVFSSTLTGTLRYGFEAQDGNYIFCGQTNSFSKGLNQNDLLIIKTDAQGNLK